MDRDDWKWYDDDDDGAESEEKEKPAEEFQCPRCTHWLPAGTAWCGYCGNVLEEKRPPRKE